MLSQNASIEWVLPCERLSETLEFYTQRLDFRIDSIFPADAPRVAHISGYGTRIRLQQSDEQAPGCLRFIADGTETAEPLVSPDGTRIERVVAGAELNMPPLKAEFQLLKKGDDAWGEGRAGMQYRDLVPDRQGGALIASHIRIPNGGPVPDYVHHHGVLFQLIYCAEGWVKVVYEDQGPEFVLRAGDCVLQPPGIRHRVLESSDGMEVIEVSAPAEHMTFVDHDLSLPTVGFKPDRLFGGQKFVRHQTAGADWQANAEPGFDICDTGLTEASNGLITLQVLRANGDALESERRCPGELQFWFVLKGSAKFMLNGKSHHVTAEDAFLIPNHSAWNMHQVSADLKLLRLTVWNYPG